ncbi:MAG: hypothetical protein WBE26_15875, partial [Phycisphaerae bacterium]
MYWTSSGWHGIFRANLDGTGKELLVSTGVADPISIALDVADGKMYWISLGDAPPEPMHKIQRANLDGTGVENLVITGVDSAMEIVLDLEAGKMYWAESYPGNIMRANLDGTGVEVVLSELGGLAGIALDPDEAYLYWTNY